MKFLTGTEPGKNYDRRIGGKHARSRVFLRDLHNCQTPVLGLGLGVYFTFARDTNNNNNHKNNHRNNPHLNFVKGTLTRG